MVKDAAGDTAQTAAEPRRLQGGCAVGRPRIRTSTGGNMSDVPPYQDLATLARNLCAGESTIEDLVGRGQFPRPKKLGGKRVWKWTEVCEFLDGPQVKEDLEGRIRNATRKLIEAGDHCRGVRKGHQRVSGVDKVSGDAGEHPHELGPVSPNGRPP